MPPQKSAVWNYFKRSLNGNTVKCTLCDAQLTFCGGTKNLINQSINHDKHNHHRMITVLIISGDIALNPGPPK